MKSFIGALMVYLAITACLLTMIVFALVMPRADATPPKPLPVAPTEPAPAAAVEQTDVLQETVTVLQQNQLKTLERLVQITEILNKSILDSRQRDMDLVKQIQALLNRVTKLEKGAAQSTRKGTK